MLEYAFSISAFLLVIFFIIDISLYASARAVVQLAAERAARTASSMPNMDLDLRGQAASSYNCMMYKEALYRTEKEVQSITQSSTIVGDINSDSFISLLPAKYSNATASAFPCNDPNKEYRAAVIRPGEAFVSADKAHTVLDHPTVSGLPSPPNTSPGDLLRTNGVTVVVRALYKGTLFGEREITVQSTPVRQNIPQGGFGQIHDENDNLIIAPDQPTWEIPPAPKTMPPEYQVSPLSEDDTWWINTWPFGQCPDTSKPKYARITCRGAGPN